MTVSAFPRAGWRNRGPVIVAGLTVALLCLYFLLDQRLPRDPGLYWADVPRTWRALGGGRWELVGQLFQRPGSWLVLGVAALARLHRGAWVMELVSVISVGTIVACAGRLGAIAARRRGADAERWGGWLGATMAAAMPMVVVQGRLPWIHLPEAALLGVVMVVLIEDPELSRSRSWWVAAIAGVLLASVRHSGLVWLVTVLPLLRGRARWLLLPWALGAVPSVWAMAPYLLAKAQAREGYAQRLPGLVQQSWRLLGPVVVGLVAVGVVRRIRDRLGDRLLWVGGIQLGTAVLLFAVFRAGLDNFTPLVLGLVVVAAVSASRWTVAVAGVGAVWVWGLTFLPIGPPDFRTLHRPGRGMEVRAVKQLLRASCVEGPCRIGTESSLLLPNGEEPGRLELWLLGMDKVELVDLRHGARALTQLPVSAVAQWECRGDGADWLQRFPQSREWQRVGTRQQRLARAWVFRPDEGCALVWWTPDATLPGVRPRLGRSPLQGRDDDPGPK